MLNPDLTYLLLPGWQNSGPAHWQSRWEALHGFERVEQADWVWPRRGDWMACLEEALLADPRPAVLAAHSLGCHLVAAWAACAAFCIAASSVATKRARTLLWTDLVTAASSASGSLRSP